MNKNDITITVTGCAGVGKTTIAKAIEMLLNGAGIPCESVDPEGEECPPGSVTFQRIGAICQRMAEKGGKITIIEQQAMRGGDE